MLYWMTTALAAIVGLIVFERTLGAALSWLEPYLPNDFAGPDGWLVDTKHRCGIFDRE